MNARSNSIKPAPEAEAPAAVTPRSAPDPTALADFFGSLAHDLRSPLGVVTEALSELRTDFASGLTDEHRLLGTLADRGIRRLGRIADTMSLLAALESGTFELRTRPIDLIELVREAVASASAVEPRREVELVCDLPPGPLAAVADVERLSRAVTEIVINAVRHARRKARVRLELTPTEARIMIEDDGQGVAPEWQATLYSRFTARASRSGLGMGLSIAHDVVVAHHGKLTLEASTLAPGRPGTVGASFVISLPIQSTG